MTKVQVPSVGSCPRPRRPDLVIGISFGNASLVIGISAFGGRPHRNEMIPLIEVKPNGRLEGGHDALREFDARTAIAQGRAVVWNLRKNVRGVTSRGARQIDRQDSAA